MDITGSHRLHRPERPVPLRGMPDFDEERGHAGQDFRPRRQACLDRPISRRGSDWIHHISFLINALGKWVQSDPFYPLAIYPAISNSCMPKWFTGHRVRCTLFRDFSTTSMRAWLPCLNASHWEPAGMIRLRPHHSCTAQVGYCAQHQRNPVTGTRIRPNWAVFLEDQNNRDRAPRQILYRTKRRLSKQMV